MRSVLLVILAFLAFVSISSAYAQRSSTLVILMPGAGGAVPADFLVRNRGRISGAGFRTTVTTSPGTAVAAARKAKRQKQKVVLVGMSQGASRAARAIASGAPIDGVVFVSGSLRHVASTVGSPSRLPATLVVHHRKDRCRLTPPGGVGFFRSWAGGKVRVRWISTSGQPRRRACGPFGAHGFFRKDGAAVSAIVSFARSR